MPWGWSAVGLLPPQRPLGAYSSVFGRDVARRSPTLRPREAAYVPSFWPHIWAIPLIFAAGFVVGWGVCSAIQSGNRPAPPRNPYDELDDGSR